MPLESTVAEIQCYVIHDGIPLPKSTFHTEMLRLQSEDGEDYPGWLWLELFGGERADYIVKHWGRICWHCHKQIVLVFQTDPVFEKPDGADEKQYLHRSCWDRLKLAAANKRRRLRYAAKRDAQAALPAAAAAAAAAGPVAGLGYEPQPMLALEGPNPDLAPLPLPAPAPPSSESKEAAAEAEPAEAAAGGA